MENLTIQLDNLTVAVRNASLLNSTTAANQSEIPDVYESSLVDLYITPIFSSVGMIGNSLTFIVMIQLSQESSFYLYLAVLALADCGVSIFGGFLVWLDTIGLLHLFGSTEQSWCSTVFTCNLILSQFSSWITVAVCVDRYIAVCHPFKVASYCTRKRVIITLTCILGALVALDFPMLCFEWNADYTSCTFPPKSIDFCLNYLIHTDLPTYTIVPIILYLAC
ncbi:Melanin-concentrating hormone receptor 2 [Mizuhopecten yessoensis]|uniref:Melanin-concentrating hormone receptor 2 n=1 Tax=Mizuhopecten yessoensis TaxID=6573 RepID=A0A210PN59_MIZYE|nr:Melanin-concentrating hormone receptor 2 [Mizuhopecten yessoensis]